MGRGTRIGLPYSRALWKRRLGRVSDYVPNHVTPAGSCGEVEVFHKFDVYECDLKHDPFLLKLCRKARDSGESKENKSLN